MTSNNIFNKTIEYINLFKENKCALFFNGGKDSVVLLNLVKKVFCTLDNIFIAYIEKDDEFPEIKQFIQNLNIKILKFNDMKNAIGELVEQYQITHAFTGIRLSDPYGPKTSLLQKTDPDWPQIMLINPLINWTYHDIWLYIFDDDLEYCKLYDQGYTSLGYCNNTFKNNLLFDHSKKQYLEAYKLKDGKYERNGRINCKLPIILEGTVVHGHKNGKSLGFPTANIAIHDPPLDLGVYYGILDFNGQTKKFVMSNGKNTLFWDSKQHTLEIHILDLVVDDFYGKVLKFEVLGFIRKMEKIFTKAELIDLINKDIDIAYYNIP